MTTHEYYVTLIRSAPTEFIGPFRSRKKAGDFNRNECGGRGNIYHYESHRLKPFTGKVVSPKEYLKKEEKQ